MTMGPDPIIMTFLTSFLLGMENSFLWGQMILCGRSPRKVRIWHGTIGKRSISVKLIQVAVS
jgi:hypothetical protein